MARTVEQIIQEQLGRMQFLLAVSEAEIEKLREALRKHDEETKAQ